jgi:hypothetical protein
MINHKFVASLAVVICFMLPFGGLTMLPAQQADATGPDPILRVHIVSAAPAPGFAPVESEHQGLLFLSESPAITDNHIERVRWSRERDHFLLSVHLTPIGQARWREVSGRHVGDRVALVAGGIVVVVVQIIEAAELPFFAVAFDHPSPRDADQLAARMAERWGEACAGKSTMGR